MIYSLHHQDILNIYHIGVHSMFRHDEYIQYNHSIFYSNLAE
jgi:hypothetical protein